MKRLLLVLMVGAAVFSPPQSRKADLLAWLPMLEQGACSDAALAEIRNLARVNDLAARGIWPC